MEPKCVINRLMKHTSAIMDLAWCPSRKDAKIKAVIVKRVIKEVEANKGDEKEKSNALRAAGTEIGPKKDIVSRKDDKVNVVMVEELIKEVKDKKEDEKKVQSGKEVEVKSDSQREAVPIIGTKEETDSRKDDKIKAVIVKRVIKEVDDEKEDETNSQAEKEVEEESDDQSDDWSKIGFETEIEEVQSESDTSSDDSFEIIYEDQYADAEINYKTDKSKFDNKCVML